MKKLLALILITATVLSLSACGSASSEPAEAPAASAETEGLNQDYAIVGYWGITDYAKFNHDWTIEIPKDITSKKDLQESVDADILMLSFADDNTCKCASAGETVDGKWGLNKINTTEDMWWYELDLEDGHVYNVFLYENDPATLYLPITEDVVLIMGTSEAK